MTGWTRMTSSDRCVCRVKLGGDRLANCAANCTCCVWRADLFPPPSFEPIRIPSPTPSCSGQPGEWAGGRRTASSDAEDDGFGTDAEFAEDDGCEGEEIDPNDLSPEELEQLEAEDTQKMFDVRFWHRIVTL